MIDAATASEFSTSGSSDGTPAVRVRDLVKHYKEAQAVRGIALSVAPGAIFGLIGPDGAGKTTTFQIVAGVMEATSGTAEIYGRTSRDARSDVGYLTQAFSMYPDLSVWENIRYIGDLRRVAPHDIQERGRRYLGMFDMDRFSDRLAGKLSGGMKQKLSLVAALVAQPRVLLLDEPTTGVDPVSRREFWDTLAHLSADGLTIVVATPYLDEAERCHRIALMHLGEIREEGTPAELRQKLGLKRLEVRASDLREAERRLESDSQDRSVIRDVQRFGDRLDVMVNEEQRGQQAIEQQLKGLEVQPIRAAEPTLENTFVATLRSLGDNVQTPPFPARHNHADLQGQDAIAAEQLTRKFGDFTAVNGITLSVKYGEIYGLLGANGAGKTTAIRMLCGLLPPTSGTMILAGERGSFRSASVRTRIGYMSQKFSLYDDLSVDENLDFFGGVYGVPASELAEKKKWVMTFSGLEGKSDLITGSLPGGWKQRVAFGASILHEPSLLFLDEPTSGVDPLARRAFWKMVNTLGDLGTAIIVTTHYLEEAEQCNRLGFMVAGELVLEGAPNEVKKQQPGRLLEFYVDQPQRASDTLKQSMASWRVSLFGERLHVITDKDERSGEEEVRNKLAQAGVNVRSMSEEAFSLEDVFISVVEQERAKGRFAKES